MQRVAGKGQCGQNGWSVGALTAIDDLNNELKANKTTQ